MSNHHKQIEILTERLIDNVNATQRLRRQEIESVVGIELSEAQIVKIRNIMFKHDDHINNKSWVFGAEYIARNLTE